jgi:hypothetical protein
MESTTTGEHPARGGIGLIVLAILLVGALLFLTRERPRYETIPALDKLARTVAADNGEAGTDISTNSLTQTVHGQHVAYSLSLPPNWKTQSVTVSDVDNLSATFGAANIAVMVQESKVGTPEDAATSAMALLKLTATEIQSSKPERFLLDGRPWLRFVVRCRVEQAPVGYQYYVYSGAEGTYQIIAWTELASFERVVEPFRAIMNTFRFPAAPAQTGQADALDTTAKLTRAGGR